MTTPDLHMLAGAYALQALDRSEAEAFERHQETCPSCAQEVRELVATATRLGIAASITPPPELRAQVLRRISAVRQDPPRLPGTARTSRWPRPGERAYRLALAAAVATAAALGGVAGWQHQEAAAASTRVVQAQQQADALTAVLTATDAKATTTTLANGATATVVVSRILDQAVFLTPGLPSLPSGKVYQLWYNDADTMRPAGFATPNTKDQAILLTGQINAAQGMGITVEPAGGSPHPTTTPVGHIDFPNSS
jgi:anti-sigma-K factor RskA